MEDFAVEAQRAQLRTPERKISPKSPKRLAKKHEVISCVVVEKG